MRDQYFQLKRTWNPRHLAFLAITNCDVIVVQQKTVPLSPTDLTELAEDNKRISGKVIKFTDLSKVYYTFEVKTNEQYKSSEEFVYNNPVFSGAGSHELNTVLNNIPHNTILHLSPLHLYCRAARQMALDPSGLQRCRWGWKWDLCSDL